MRLDREHLDQRDKYFKTNFINAITGFKSANLVGTVSPSGQTNLAVISSVVHVGAMPPLNAMVIRPHSAARHTLENLVATGFYTINHIHRDMVAAAHQTSVRYSREQSEFAATGLDECWLDGFAAPFVGQSLIRLGMRYCEHQTLAINGAVLVIGEVVLVDVPDDCVAESGHLDLERAGTVAVSGLDGYHRTSPLARMAYAKPGQEPVEL